MVNTEEKKTKNKTFNLIFYWNFPVELFWNRVM